MDITAKGSAIRLGILALTASVTATLNSCTSAPSTQQSQSSASSNGAVKIDGSSTVFPITEAVAKEYKLNKNGNSQIQVAFSGTSAGFKKFCAGETDISNASRPILTDEVEACRQAGVRYIELPVAYDALTVAVHPQNDWAKDITIAELKKIWEPAAQGKITSWNQVRSSWPNKPLKLYGAGGESGTFDYFTEATVGKTRASRTDYTASEDDNVLVRGVGTDPNALGYFGYAYYEANQNRLKALAVNSGNGAVLPARQAVENAQYQPLSRPLLIYVNAKYAQNKPEVRAFVEFYLKNANRLVNSVGYIPLPEEGYHIAFVHFERGKVGTVFAGEQKLNLTIGELLRQEAKF